MVDKNRTRRWWWMMACTPIAVAMCVLPVPGPPMSTMFLGIVEELTAMQGLHLADTNAAFVEVEACEIPVCREPSDLHLVVDGNAPRVRRLRP